MAEDPNTDLTSQMYRPKSKLESESIVVPLIAALFNLITTEEQKNSLSPDQGGYN